MHATATAATTTSQVDHAAAAPIPLAKVKKEIMAEQRAMELKKCTA
jgi:hypothetical protein